MALSKANTHDHNTSIDTLIQPTEVEEVAMGINPAAMKLIIDRLTDLYPHPVSSSVREVVSNAIDATVRVPEADREPVEIFSPTSLNASFKVRDHGVGMSLEDVRKIYSQYGGSTKTDDFTQLGAYGLGAKAPLAYCSEFQVTTTKDGITTIFTCARKAMGNVTTIISSTPTDKEAGTEVVIPVKTHDLHEFQEAINNFTKFAPDVPLKVNGALVATEEKYQLFDTLILDEDTHTVGRVWMNNEAAQNYFSTLLGSRYRNLHEGNIHYVLSGWLYNSPASSYRGDSVFIVELKPGVVDFSSSRDSITRNERSHALDKRVVNYYSTLTDVLLEKALVYYRDLSEDAAWNFLTDLNPTVKGNKVTIDQGGKQFKLTLEDFALTSGTNPLKTFAEAKKENCFGVVHLTEAGRDYRFSPAATRTGDNFQITAPNVHGRVGDISDAICEAVEKDTRSPMLFNVLNNRRVRNYYGRVTNPATVIVTGVDEEFADFLRKARTVICKDVFPENLMVLTSSVTDEEVETARTLLATTVTKITPAEVVQLVADARAERRKNSAPRETDTELSVTVYDGTAHTTPTAFLKTRSASAIKRVSEIIAEGNIIIVGDHMVTALKGAANGGATITGKKVYVLDPRHLRAGHYELMLGYKNAFVTSDFVPRCKAAVTLAGLQRREAHLFNEEVEELTMGQAVACLTQVNSFADHVWVEITSAATGTEFEGAFDALLKADRNFRMGYAYRESLLTILTHHFGEDTAEKLIALDAALSTLFRDYGQEARLYKTLSLRDYYDASALTGQAKALISAVAPFIVTYLTEAAAKAQAEAAATTV